ncbi:MAG: DegT/DnrJ/EryC1/StrS family aminotransferase [Solirubrobacteraceae bacterium]
MARWDVPLADVIVTDEDIGVVSDVYRSGWLSMGPRTEELEARLAAYVGSRHALAVSSGTAALHLMCLAAGLGPGDEVIVPSMTFVATANAVAYTGARPVFADIVSLTEPWLSVEAARASITDRTRAIMAMSYGGHPGQIAELASLCAERGLILLEDAAHGLGSRLGDRGVGTFGAAGAFSFFSNKNLAVGEGGAIVTDDDDLDRRLRLLRSHGMTTLSWDRHRGHATGYDVVALGFNYRIDEPRAALAAARLQRLDADNRERARLDAAYREGLQGLDLACALAAETPVSSAHHLFCVVLPDGRDRDAFRARLAAARVQTSVHYPAVHRFSIYDDGQPPLPVTEAYAGRTVTLPLFAHMTLAQQGQVIEAVTAAAREPTAQPL